MRPDVDRYFMDMSRLVASRSTCVRRSVGCVLVNARNRVLATGYNGPPDGRPHCNEIGVNTTTRIGVPKHTAITFPNACPGAAVVQSGMDLDACLAVHAEQNAILQCSDAQTIERAYVTAFPCPSCAKLLLNTSCKEIVYLDPYGDGGGNRMWLSAGRLCRQFEGEPPMIQRDIVRLFGAGLEANAWRIVIACVCLNLASARQARGIVFRILHRWPTPNELSKAGTELEVILRPLGLSNRRAANMRALSAQWGNVAMEALPGVGPYALESVAVFCHDELPNSVGDRKVAAWVAWKRKQLESEDVR